jgi:hypothetical protein
MSFLLGVMMAFLIFQQQPTIPQMRPMPNFSQGTVCMICLPCVTFNDAIEKWYFKKPMVMAPSLA